MARLWAYKNRYNALHPEKKNVIFPAFNILVLSDRIAVVDQLHEELVDGIVDTVAQTVKPPILPEDMIHTLAVKVYHSQVDDVLE